MSHEASAGFGESSEHSLGKAPVDLVSSLSRIKIKFL